MTASVSGEGGSVSGEEWEGCGSVSGECVWKCIGSVGGSELGV